MGRSFPSPNHTHIYEQTHWHHPLKADRWQQAAVARCDKNDSFFNHTRHAPRTHTPAHLCSAVKGTKQDGQWVEVGARKGMGGEGMTSSFDLQEDWGDKNDSVSIRGHKWKDTEEKSSYGCRKLKGMQLVLEPTPPYDLTFPNKTYQMFSCQD